ncbi:MAG: exodeoxyribonuclease VII large subunit [Deltaproteobacteria bacterium 37-65-8]|nr:MAG: exodeoxyribonuclease VII large subunit [Deltaproteobacteria bacterium 37-65-8]
MEPDLFAASPSGDVLSVTELTGRIKRLLESSFRTVRVEGEVSNYKRYEASGHRYFSLKDEGAQIRVVLFRGNERNIYGEIRDGQTVIVTGSLGVFEKKGEYQIYARSVEVRGVGNLLVELERRKRRLAEEGLFDAARKRPLPPFPKRLGIVTSLHGAVLRDMVRVARSRFPGVAIVLSPSLVQGEGAAADIAAALDALYASGEADIVIVGRGGGSIEDLWAFNEEAVVRAIVRSPVPVISAVGHETDFTLADLAADHRAPTPTAAAQMAVPDRVELLDRVAALSLRARRADARSRETARQEWRIAAGKLSDPRPLLQGKRYAVDALSSSLSELARSAVRDGRETVERLSASVRIHSPAAWVSGRRGELAVLLGRSRSAAAARNRRLRSDLDVLRGKLASLNPTAVLTRGYAIALDCATGKAVRSVSETRAGQVLDLRVSDGAFGAVVTEPET